MHKKAFIENRSNGIRTQFMNALSVFAMLLLTSCQASEQTGQNFTPPQASTVPAKNLAIATFAGGCFWCMEAPFDVLPGVISSTSGYTGGFKDNPSYEEVSSGATGHAEAVQIVYDSTQISYAGLLEVFWHNIDPLTANRQFCDAGSQYRAAIFYHNEEQRRLAEASKQTLEQSGRFKQPIVTEIVPFSKFYDAEEYHQDYYKKNTLHYKAYRTGCGRDRRLRELWGEK
jgi:peptide-methionine (S)-S-oxide reductase